MNSDSDTRVRPNGLRPRASLLSLLTLTALMALGIAIVLAVRKQRELVTQKQGLLAVSSQLIVEDEDRLAYTSLFTAAGDFESWEVHVPDNRDFAVYLGIGALRSDRVPPIVDTMPIPAGRHRVTFHCRDSTNAGFRYDVYLDGEKQIEQVMGKEWMPNGWSSASGIGWPAMEDRSEAPMQLAARSYQPRHNFGRNRYFQGQGDSSVTRLGYRLWIDEKNQSYPEPRPFLESMFEWGMMDGLRYESDNQKWEWEFFRPTLEARMPAIRVSPEFVLQDGEVLTSQTSDFRGWMIDHQLNDDPEDSETETFLNLVGTNGKPGALVRADRPPIVEMKWEVGKPDAVGMRLADVPENEAIDRWTLRIQGGSEHLWRKLVFKDTVIDTLGDAVTAGELELDLTPSGDESAMLWWYANESLPLQIASDENEAYSDLELFDGLAVMQGVEVPVDSDFRVSAIFAEEMPNEVGVAFPGGPILEAIQIELDAKSQDWIWIYAKERQGQ